MIDRLTESIKQKGAPVVVGLDPTLEIIPENIIKDSTGKHGGTPEAAAAAILKFNREIVDAVAGIVPAVKPNIAFYERYGIDGIRAYISTIEYAKERGLMVIGDVKRGDIGSTAAAYAGHIEPAGLFGREFEIWHEDAVTLNPYLGEDSVRPFLEVMKDRDKGVFILVKTSNAGSSDIQDLIVSSAPSAGSADARDISVSSSGMAGGEGTEHSGGAPLYEHVAGLVSAWGRGDGLMGECGYSKVGAVVGATHADVGARLRELMPHTFFLVPGYGAQGASAKDIRRFFNAGGGGVIVNSSRGIIGAWKAGGRDAGHVGKAARAAAVRMIDEIGSVL